MVKYMDFSLSIHKLFANALQLPTASLIKYISLLNYDLLICPLERIAICLYYFFAILTPSIRVLRPCSMIEFWRVNAFNIAVPVNVL